MEYQFEWNQTKARSNVLKHKVSFSESSSIFFDRNALSLYDANHSTNEERWITIGLSKFGKLIVLSHTFQEDNKKNVAFIRIISARKATKKEAQSYYKEQK